MSWSIQDVLALSQHYMPYFSHWVWQVVPIATPSVPLMATDCYCRLYYNPSTIPQLALRDSAAVFLHELLHVQGRHADRAKALSLGTERELATWNIATDLAINSILACPHIGLGEHAVFLQENGMMPSRFGFPADRSAEEYYRLLVQADQQGDQAVRAAIDMAMAQRSASMRGGTPANGQADDPRWPGMGSSSADGEARPWEQGEPDGQHPGLPKWKRDRIDAATAEAIEQHERRHGIGTVPGQWARRVREVLDPPVDPMTALRSAIRYAVNYDRGFGDYTWSRPARREPAGVGYAVPATVRPLPNVAVLIDTSGSMGGEDLALALGVIRRALRSLDGVRVCSADTEVHTARKVFSERRVELLGGGGTDMDHAMRQVAESVRCDAMIVVTDGLTPWPTSPPCRQVVIALTRSPEASPPEWARVVKIGKEG